MYLTSKWLDGRSKLVIDTDFEETITLENRTLSGWEAIIRVYEKRGLNVVGNLFRAIQEYSANSCDGDTRGTIDLIATSPEDVNPSFSKYHDELMKYLILV